MREVLLKQGVRAVVDVWCEAPMTPGWAEVVETLRKLKVEGFLYHFVVGKLTNFALSDGEEAGGSNRSMLTQVFVGPSPGVHPHAAKSYSPEVEAAILEAYRNPACVGWGEIGLVRVLIRASNPGHSSSPAKSSPQDYKYDNSPREVQQRVLRSQLRTFLKAGLGKALTIHTREADDDIFTILTEELPRTQKVISYAFHLSYSPQD